MFAWVKGGGAGLSATPPNVGMGCQGCNGWAVVRFPVACYRPRRATAVLRALANTQLAGRAGRNLRLLPIAASAIA